VSIIDNPNASPNAKNGPNPNTKPKQTLQPLTSAATPNFFTLAKY